MTPGAKCGVVPILLSGTLSLAVRSLLAVVVQFGSALPVQAGYEKAQHSCAVRWSYFRATQGVPHWASSSGEVFEQVPHWPDRSREHPSVLLSVAL